MGEHVTEVDLQAYIDGQLDVPRRIEVETFLQAQPETAARIMEELRRRDELRLFLSDDSWAPPAPTVDLSRQLERRLAWRSAGLTFRRAAAAMLLLVAGWFAHDEFDSLFVDVVAAAHPVPTFVEEAVEVYEVARLRLDAGLAPYPTVLPLTAHHGNGRMPIPALTDGVRLLGSDLVPWDGGPAVLVLYRDGLDHLVCLFAAEVENFNVASPQTAAVRGHATVYWQNGHFAYALSGDLPEADLLTLSRKLAPRPWTGALDQPLPARGEPHG